MDTLTLRRFSKLNLLELLTDPVANFALLDMHELHADFITVSFTVGTDKIPQLPLRLALCDSAVVGHANGEFTIHICLSEAVVGRV